MHPKLRKGLLFVSLSTLVVVLFAAFTLHVIPISQAFQFDTDEGIQLVTASLFNQGYQLYIDVWKDHPPVHTLILAKWLSAFSYSVTAARLLTVCFAALLVGAFYQLVSVTVGIGPALVSCAWLVVSAHFLKMSTSVMIGLPALSLAVLSLLILFLSRRYRSHLLVLTSAAIFALATQTKLFVLPLLPMYLWLLLPPDLVKRSPLNLNNRKLLARAGIWLLGFGAFYYALIHVLPSPGFQQAVLSHVDQDTRGAYPWLDSFGRVLLMFFKDFDYTLLAWLAVRRAYQSGQIRTLIPAIWLAFTIPALVVHTPVWYHHYLLLSLPLIWLAAYSLKSVLDDFSREFYAAADVSKHPAEYGFRDRLLNLKQTVVRAGKYAYLQKKLTVSILIISLVLWPVKLNVSVEKAQKSVQETENHLEVVSIIKQHQSQTRWLLTDLPMYAFRTDINVIPELAVVSQKRWKSGSLTEADIKRLLRQYQPEQIVLGRFEQMTDIVQSDFSDQYQLIFENDAAACYLSRSLKPLPSS